MAFGTHLINSGRMVHAVWHLAEHFAISQETTTSLSFVGYDYATERQPLCASTGHRVCGCETPCDPAPCGTADSDMCSHVPSCPGVVACRNLLDDGQHPLSDQPSFSRSIGHATRKNADAWLATTPMMYAIFFERKTMAVCPLAEFRPCRCGQDCPGIYRLVHDEHDIDSGTELVRGAGLLKNL